MKKILELINGFIDRFVPKLDIAGLEISDGLIRFYAIGRGEHKAKHILLRLPPGAVVNGRIVNADALHKTLVDLHKRVSSNPKKLMSAIVSLPINHVYIQPFSLPIMSRESLGESAELNLRMISPVDVSKAYYDWQEVQENLSKDQLDMVGAFVLKDVVDKFIEVLQGANFSVAAVEFSSLSLIRDAVKNGLIKTDAPSLLLQIDQGGLGFSISHNGSLYFHYFTEWDIYRDGGKNIDVGKFKAGVVEEARKLINFYLTSFKTEDIKNILVIAESFTEDVKAALQSGLSGVQVQTVNFDQINSAHGAALRGRVVRSRDASISLANLSAIDVFRRGQITNFISLWRNVAFTSLGFLLVVFLSSALLLQQVAERVRSNDPFANENASSIELAGLERGAEEFNKNIAMLRALSPKAGAAYRIVDKITALMGASVKLRRLTINTESGLITLGGSSKTEELARAFKDKLQEDDLFTNVDLPLQGIKPQVGGGVEFQVEFKLEALNS